MNNEPTLALMYDRAVAEIASQLDTSVNFLCKYEVLIAQDISVLEECYQDIEFIQQCYLGSTGRAQNCAFAFKLIFLGSSFSDRLGVIESWTSKIQYSLGVFHNIEQYKTLIKHVADSMRSGTLEQPNLRVMPYHITPRHLTETINTIVANTDIIGAV